MARADIARTERRREAIELRKRGCTFEEIGRQLGVSIGTAYNDVVGGLRETLQEPAAELRKMEVERLDAMLAALWPVVTETGHKQQARAVEQALSLMDRRAKLLGLDAPARKVVNVITEDAVDAAIRELEAQLADHGGVRDPGTASEAREAAGSSPAAASSR